MTFQILPLPAEDKDTYPRAEMRFDSGDYGEFEIVLEDPDPDSVDPDNPDMIPRNLTGYQGLGQIRKSNKLKDLKGNPIPVLANLTFSGFDSNGVVTVVLTETESAKVREKGVWDIQFTDSLGHVDTIVGGPANPKGDVSR